MLSVPPSGTAEDDRVADLREIVDWLVHAAAILAPDQVSGRWQAEVHTR